MKKSGRQRRRAATYIAWRSVWMVSVRNVIPILLPILLTIPCSAQVRINEVHAVPAAGEPEWIELVNTRSVDVRMTSWSVCDA